MPPAMQINSALNAQPTSSQGIYDSQSQSGYYPGPHRPNITFANFSSVYRHGAGFTWAQPSAPAANLTNNGARISCSVRRALKGQLGRMVHTLSILLKQLKDHLRTLRASS